MRISEHLLILLVSSCCALNAWADTNMMAETENSLLPPSEFQFTPKIVGGLDAEEGPYRWTVSLQTPQGFHFCGGSLINSGWVVTAAHCVQQPANAFRVVVDRNNLNNNNGNVHTIGQVIVHPGYNPDTFDNDIALLRLNANVNAEVPTISMATPEVMAQSGVPGEFARALGWGALSEGGPGSAQLQRVDVPLLSNADCNAAYNGLISDNMVCAGFEQGLKDACQGDSGGPLVINHEGEFVLAGIVSWGFGCARPGLPGVYARVENFIGFVSEFVAVEQLENEVLEVNVLENGVPVTDLSAQIGEELRFTIVVPEGATNLSFNISDGQGDADLYVNLDAPAGLAQFICRPYINGNEESCIFESPEAGAYHVMVRAFNNFSGLSLVVSFDAEEAPDVALAGLSENNLSADRGEWLTFTLDVEPGATNLKVSIDGGSGDADLYVRFGQVPTRRNFDCRPFLDGNTEDCELDAPEAGTWFIRLRGYQDFEDVSLKAVVQ